MAGIGDALLQISAVGVIILIVLRLSIGRASFRLPRRSRTRRIVAIGVGGAGCNAIDSMIRAKIRGVDFVACNTDLQALRRSRARTKVQIGRQLTGGLGSGGDPEVGRRAAEEDAPRIAKVLEGARLVVVAAGLGGGTGSGAAPIVARIAREQGALAVAVATLPFNFEGERRTAVAQQAAAALGAAADTIITISNERLNTFEPESASLLDAFGEADRVLTEAVGSITRLLSVAGLVNLDFADLRAVLSDGGPALFGVGRAHGEGRAIDAARDALEGPLLERQIGGARSVLFHVVGPSNLRLAEIRAAAEEIRALADPNANVIFGATLDRWLRDEVRITIIATGLATAAAVAPSGAQARPRRASARPEPQPEGDPAASGD